MASSSNPVKDVLVVATSITSALIYSGNGTVGAPSFSFTSDTDSGMYRVGANHIGFVTNGVSQVTVSTTALNTRTGFPIAVGTKAFLVDDATDVLALKNGTAAQEFRIYGTTTGPKYLSLSHDGTNGFINASTNGATATLKLQTVGVTRWNINQGGTLYPEGDGTQNIGSSGNRAAALYSLRGIFGVATNDSSNSIYIGNDTAESLVFDTAAGQSTFNGRRASTSQASRAIVASGDIIMGLNADGWDGAAYRNAAKIEFGVDATPGSSDMPGFIKMYTTPDGSATPGLSLYISSAKVVTFYHATFHTTAVTLTNGAAAQVGTLTNAPAAGNPTKWAPVNDNGTTRYVPMW